jgi:hypothetical protein
MGKAFKASKWVEKNSMYIKANEEKPKNLFTHGLFGKTGGKKYFK